MVTNIARVEGRLLVVSSTIGAPTYDFDFDLHFRCDHPFRFQTGETCVLRIGPVPDYAAQTRETAEWGLSLVNSAEDHHRASDIEGWYPLIADLTPVTRIYDDLPSIPEIEAHFRWPVFVKGARQTSKHNPSLAVARTPDEYVVLCEGYRRDPILHWQRPVIRQFEPLEPIKGVVPGKLTPSCEFRTFWWNGRLVGSGCYWHQLPAYRARDLDQGLEIAQRAAQLVGAPFLVVDIARRIDGEWIVIECNDAQEAGYCGVPPRELWGNILETLDIG